MSGRTEFTQAVLLRSVNYGDADRILTFLTADQGKLSAMARGARRSQKRFLGALEPFQLVEVELAVAGSGRLRRLAQARVVAAYPGLLANLERMNRAGEALELVREIAAEDHPEAELFEATVQMLDALQQPEPDPAALWACFALRALALAGFAPRLDACGRCGKRPAADQAGLFDSRHGHLVCRACGGAPHKLSGAGRTCLARAAAGAWQASAAEMAGDELASIHRAVHAFAEHRLERHLRE